MFLVLVSVDRAGEDDMSVEDAVNDEERQTYYQGYLESMVAAVGRFASVVCSGVSRCLFDHFASEGCAALVSRGTFRVQGCFVFWIHTYAARKVLAWVHRLRADQPSFP